MIFSDFIHLYLPYCESFFLYFLGSEHIPSGLENILIIKSGDLIKIKFFYSFSQSELTFFSPTKQKKMFPKEKIDSREFHGFRVRCTYRHRDGLHWA